MLVEFIIPTYYRPHLLKAMLASLVAQYDGDWGALVMIDNDKNEEVENVCSIFNDSRIRWAYTEKRYNDWGHTPRQLGKQMSQADYIIMTGDDNYYTPNFVEELRKTVVQNNNPGVVFWNMVHSHYDYRFFECRFANHHIDMGAFATRKDIAHEIDLGTEYAADGIFVEKVKSRYANELFIRIDKVLFVHN
jgi:glycosyltransferase involved in cell wall biosynthesis